MPTSQVVSLDSSWQGIKGSRGWIIGIGCMRHRITWLRRNEWLEICFYDGRGGLGTGERDIGKARILLYLWKSIL